MSYTKQTFTSGQILKASDLNTMSEGITTKQDKLVSGTNIKTINGQSLLGEGDVTVVGDGKEGKSAYQIALDNGFEGSEAEWLASLKGEKGDVGSGVIAVDESLSDTSENAIQNKAVANAFAEVKDRISLLDGIESNSEVVWTLGKGYYNSGNEVKVSTATHFALGDVTLQTGDCITADNSDLGSLFIYYYLDGTLTKASALPKPFYAPQDGTYHLTIQKKEKVAITNDEVSSIFKLKRSKVSGEVNKLVSSYATYQVPMNVRGVGQLAKYKDFDENSETLLQDLYDWYDDLSIAHASTMSRTQFGTTQEPDENCAKYDSKTYPMYAYTIAPLEYSKHKVILAYGIHGNGSGGDVIEGVVSLAYFVKDLLNNYYKHPTMSYLRKWCTVVVMPVLNPWGYQNRSRGNGRNIDLNRNFSHGFAASNEPSNANAYFNGHPIISGTSAFSEAESVAIRDYITTNHSDAVFMLEGHSRGPGDRPVDRFLTFVADTLTSSPQTVAIKDLTAKLVKKYGGSSVGGTASEKNGQCFRYFVEELNMFAYETECFGTYSQNTALSGTESIQIMCTDFVANTILTVAESFGMTE